MEGISRVSQELSPGNLSHNLGKISPASNENALKLIKNLSDIVKDKENLSASRKHEFLLSLNSLASELSNTKSEPLLSEDSGHSSVDDQLLKGNESLQNELQASNEKPLTGTYNSNEYQALDLSLKKTSCISDGNKKVLGPCPTTPRQKPPPYIPKTPKRNSINTLNISTTSNDSNTNKNLSYDSSQSNISGKSGNNSGRSSMVSQNKITSVTGKLKKAKVGVVVSKKGPLRAVLPLENMAKGAKAPAITPDRNDNVKQGLRSKRTSTPIQEPMLKPKVTSTPTYQTKEKDCAISPLTTKPKYYRSFSERHLASSYKKTDNIQKSRESNLSALKSPIKASAKTEGPKTRRNSVTEGLLNVKKEKHSEGKEPKILSALSKIRQNILNSPYYNPRASMGNSQTAQMNVLAENVRKTTPEPKGNNGRLSMVPSMKKCNKENIKD